MVKIYFPKNLIGTLILIVGFVSPFFGQDEDVRTGKWTGILELPGIELEMILELDQPDGEWIGNIDVPLQSISDMELQSLVVSTDSISFRLPEVPGNAAYKGAFTDNQTIQGIFSQSGQKLELEFEKIDEAARKAEEERVQKIVEKLSNMADSILIKQNLPGLGFGIVKEGDVIMSKGFGFRDIVNEIPVTDKTLFAIGSCSKAFTAMDLAILTEKGKMEWDTPVKEYMPDFKLYDEFATEEMTAVDLLTHQSGLPRHDLMWYGSPMDRYELYSRLQYLPPSKSFRSTWQYQNLMYMTAGILVERISSQTWEEFTQENILDPLNMNHTVFTWDAAKKSNDIALGYSQSDEQLELTPYRDIENVGPAGSIVSNVSDMLHWITCLLEGGKYQGTEIVTPETVDYVQQSRKVIENSESTVNPEFSSASYGLGWGIGYYKGTKTVSHSGGIDGFSAYVMLVPRDNIGMVLLCNAGGAGGAEVVLARTAIDLLLEKEEIDWYKRIFGDETEDEEEEEEEETKQKEPVPNTSPSHPLEEYTGEYEHPGYGKITVSLKEDSLHIVYNAFDQTISHYHYDVFSLEVPQVDIGFFVSFYSNPDGYIDRLSIPLEITMDRQFYFEKLPPDLMSETYLSRILGDYMLESSETPVKLYQSGTKLFVEITGQPPYELEPYQEDEFNLVDLNGFSVKFYFDDDMGEATYLEFLQPNGIFKANRE